jgi:hypothetical protein
MIEKVPPVYPSTRMRRYPDGEQKLPDPQDKIDKHNPVPSSPSFEVILSNEIQKQSKK